MGRLVELAQRLMQDCQEVENWMEQNQRGSSEVSLEEAFEKATITDAPEHVEQIRMRIVDNAADLRSLTQDPTDLVRECTYAFSTVFAMRAIEKYQLAQHVPLQGDVSFAQVAASAEVPEHFVRRVMQLAASKHIFQQTSLVDGTEAVRHSAASRAIVETAGFSDEIGMLLEEISPSVTHTMAANDKYGSDFGVEPSKTGFSVAHSTSDPIYIELNKDPQRSKRFGKAMRSMTAGAAYELIHIVTSQKDLWSSVAAKGGTVVDIGGGQGAVSRRLAEHFPGLHCVVQDLPKTADAGKESLPKNLESQVSFEAHDFFTPQSKRGADVYLLRWILHNWSDRYVIKILQNIVPALKNGSIVVIYEYLLSEPLRAGSVQDWYQRCSDLIMLAAFNGAERSEKQFKSLFAQADHRFTLKRTASPVGSALSAIQFEFVE